MKILAGVALAAALTAASISGASAAVISTYDQVTDWTDPLFAPYATNTATAAGGTWASGRTNVFGSVSGIYRSPYDGSGVEDAVQHPSDPLNNPNYWATLGYWSIGGTGAGNAPNPDTLTFSQTMSGFSFILGSIDDYDGSQTVVFSGIDSDPLTVSLATLVPQPVTAIGAILISFSGYLFNTITFSSNTAAIEVGSFRATVASVPVPAGILLLGSALAGMGFLSRRKKRVSEAAAA